MVLVWRWTLYVREVAKYKERVDTILVSLDKLPTHEVCTGLEPIRKWLKNLLEPRHRQAITDMKAAVIAVVRQVQQVAGSRQQEGRRIGFEG